MGMKKKVKGRTDRIITLLWIGIAMLIVLTVLFLIVLYFLMAYGCKNSSGDFLASMGSYLGGVIGGVGALIAVLITVMQTRKIQNENREAEIRHMIVSCYTKYIVIIEETYRLVGKFEYHKSEVKDAEHSIESAKNNSNNMIENLHQKSRNEYIREEQDALERHKAAMVNTDDRLTDLARAEKELYQTLRMHLKILGNSEEIIDSLELIHGHYYEDNAKNYLEGWPYTQIADLEAKMEGICQ